MYNTPMNVAELSGEIFLCVFAHPDDESFGPGGTLTKLAQKNDVYLLCVTDGKDPGRAENDLVKVRQRELEQAAEVIGITDVFYLNYPDGSLNNNLYHEVAGKVQEIIDDLRPTHLMTFDTTGVSGHLDHIALAMICHYIFREDKSLEQLWFYAVPKEESDMMQDYFIYFPEGRTQREIDLTVDISDIYETKVKAMHAHQSQIKDIKKIESMMEKLPREEHFLIKKRTSQ